MNTPRLVLRSLAFALFVALPACDQFGNPTDSDMGPGGDLGLGNRFGMVRVTGTIMGASAIATFIAQQQQQAGCLRRAVGECVLFHCDSPSFVQPNAGTITIAGGATTVNLVPRADGSYIPYSTTSMVTFPAGQKLSLDALGGTVPSFRSEITPPNYAFSVTNPDGSRPSVLFTINRQRDFRLTWTPLSAGSRVHAELLQDPQTNQSSALECDFDGVTGEGTIPTALLGSLRLTDTSLNHTGLFVIAPSTNVNLRLGGWDVVIYGMANGREGTVSIADN